jgi:putative endonuclease
MKKTGDIWEILAIEYLQKKGYSIRDTNFKFGRSWEIDVIAEQKGKVYFFEVKYRSHLWYWYPEESIIPKKLHKCLKTMQYYCVKHNISLQNIQFDVLTFLKWDTSHRVTHYKNIEL